MYFLHKSVFPRAFRSAFLPLLLDQSVVIAGNILFQVAFYGKTNIFCGVFGNLRNCNRERISEIECGFFVDRQSHLRFKVHCQNRFHRAVFILFRVKNRIVVAFRDPIAHFDLGREIFPLFAVFDQVHYDFLALRDFLTLILIIGFCRRQGNCLSIRFCLVAVSNFCFFKFDGVFRKLGGNNLFRFLFRNRLRFIYRNLHLLIRAENLVAHKSFRCVALFFVRFFGYASGVRVGAAADFSN